MLRLIIALCYLLPSCSRGHGGGGRGRSKGKRGKGKAVIYPAVLIVHRGNGSTRTNLEIDPCVTNQQVGNVTCRAVQEGIFIDNLKQSNLTEVETTCEGEKTREECEVSFDCYQKPLEVDDSSVPNELKIIRKLNLALEIESRKFQKELYGLFDIKEDLNKPCTCVSLHDTNTKCSYTPHYDVLQKTLKFNQVIYNTKYIEMFNDIVIQNVFEVFEKYIQDISKWNDINPRDLRLIVFKYHKASTYKPKYDDITLEYSIRNKLIDHLKRLVDILDSYTVPSKHTALAERKKSISDELRKRRKEIQVDAKRIFECQYKIKSIENMTSTLSPTIDDPSTPIPTETSTIDFTPTPSLDDNQTETSTIDFTPTPSLDDNQTETADNATSSVDLTYGTGYDFYPRQYLPEDTCGPVEKIESSYNFLFWLIPLLVIPLLICAYCRSFRVNRRTNKRRTNHQENETMRL